MRYVTDEESYRDFHQSLESALEMQGLALLCTAIYQTFRRQLTLFHAICVLHLLAVLGFGLNTKNEYGHRGRNRWIIMQALKILISGCFLAFAAYIWATAPTFGSQPACNASTIYVVFGVSINATNIVFRYVILGLMALTMVGMIWNMLFCGTFLACICGRHRRDQENMATDLGAIKDIMRRIDFGSSKKGRAAEVQTAILGMLLRTGINIYAVVTLEETVRRNDLGAEEREWTFGQVIAIFLLLGVGIEVMNIFLAKLDGREEDEEEEEQMGTDTAEMSLQQQQQPLGLSQFPGHVSETSLAISVSNQETRS